LTSKLPSLKYWWYFHPFSETPIFFVRFLQPDSVPQVTAELQVQARFLLARSYSKCHPEEKLNGIQQHQQLLGARVFGGFRTLGTPICFGFFPVFSLYLLHPQAPRLGHLYASTGRFTKAPAAARCWCKAVCWFQSFLLYLLLSILPLMMMMMMMMVPPCSFFPKGISECPYPQGIKMPVVFGARP